MRRLSKTSFTCLSLAVCSSLLLGCGDNIPAEDQTDGGTGGSLGGSGGGGAAGAGGSAGVGGTAATGGNAGTGVGGLGGTGGVAGAGGSAGNGGAGTGGAGGAGTGGAAGGSGGTAGSGTGGATVATCTGLAFTDPVNGKVLTAADDASGDACGNGFQYNVLVSVVAPNGTSASLLGTSGATSTTLATTTVTGGVARFASVLLPTGDTTLSVKLGPIATVCPTTATVTVDCTRPSVKIVSPVADAPPFTSDVSKHLLAATATQAFKDSSSSSAGAQTTVVACTNRIGTAKLLAGQAGGTLTQVGVDVTSVAAVAADNCPSGLPFVAKFVIVTLPESVENLATGALITATELRVDITDAAITTATGSSALTDLWVDSTAPTISESTPSPLCGGTAPSATGTFTTQVTLNSSTAGVTLAVTNSGTTTTQTAAYAGSVATFASVSLPLGQNTLLAKATEPSGNSATLPQPCLFTVGTVPIVTFTSPAPNATLCGVGNTTGTCTVDGDAVTAGWQGNVSVSVTVGGVPASSAGSVNLTIAGVTTVVPIDSSGNATLAAATIPEGSSVVTANTTIGTAVGATTSTFVVDSIAPAAVTGLGATVNERRQTSFSLDWTAPSDNGAAVASYDIRVKTFDGTTCGSDIRTLTYPGTPKAPGAAENLIASNLFIENNYCFSIVPRDAVGNVAAAATASAMAQFNKTTLTGTGTEAFGVVTDGTGDFGQPGSGGFANDRLSDLVVGTNNGQSAYLFFGRTGGYPTTADVVFNGPANQYFGFGVAAAGDLDGDGLTDIAISAPGVAATDNGAVYIFSRKNAPWAVNGGWPASVSYTQASYVITADSSYRQNGFGIVLARIGNFDGVGSDDLAIGASLYDPASGMNAGRVVIVKGSTSLASITLPDSANTIVIDGEAAGDQFGRQIQSLPDTTLIVGAPRAASSAGKLYAFRWPLASTVVAGVVSAYDVTTGTVASGRYGFNLATLGPLGPSPGVVAVSAPIGNFVDVHMVAASDGVFGGSKGSVAVPTVHFTSTTTPSNLGLVNIGSQVSGSSTAGSLIGGDSVPDLVIAGQGEANGTVFVVSGAAITAMSGTVDLSLGSAPSIIAVHGVVPSTWVGLGRASSLVLDLNGDGYSDFTLTEAASTTVGHALVLW